MGDDFCDADQAVALARKLVSDGVVFVAGHLCSHASIPASKVYEEAGILMISPGSASAKLTDEGGPNVFRVYGRDDRQGAMVGDYLAEHWADKEIAILDDGTTWGAGVADGSPRRRLHERGVTVAMDETFTPGEAEYSALVSKMQAAGVDVLFLGGYHRETGLIFRQAHDRGYDLRLVASSAMATEDFPMIAGPGLEGTLMIATADMRESPQAAEVVARFRAQGYEPLGTTLYAYAAVQVWAQAVEAAGSLDLDAVTAGHAQPPVRHGAGQDRLRREGRRHRLRAVAMVRLAGGRHLRAAGARRRQGIASGTRSRASDFPHCGWSNGSAEYFPQAGGLNHGPPQIAFRRCHFDCGAVRAGGGAEILIGVAGPMTGAECLVRRAVSSAARRWRWPTSTPRAACSASR